MTGETKHRFTQSFIGYVILVALPCIHIGIIQKIWTPNKPEVDKKTCTCECFDTVYKGSYEYPPSKYKHVYFNATAETGKIWAITMLAVLSLYETIKYLTRLLSNRCLRRSMFILFASVVYSHYYSWWSYFGYYSDNFYQQWYHQLFFTVTEVVSTVFVLNLCDIEVEMTPRKLLVILSISCLHIIVSSGDQFIENVILQNWSGKHQFFRDIGFMFPDLLHFIVPLYELWRLSKLTNQPLRKIINKFEIIIAVATVTATSIVVKIVL
ncbi:uncharacterized protein LOC141909894 [Tubulanus polymorphus]|uniref:uncharacterized protein LOC141909894 n=1 Tax=Tubulanus polymorphus TaxID=672921 RepID=UPI003DA30391